MNSFSKIDMTSALHLTRQGRLKDAVAVLRGGSAGVAPHLKPANDPVKDSAGPLGFIPDALRGALGRIGQFGAATISKRPNGPAARMPDPEPGGSRFEERSYSNAAGTLKYKLFVPGGYQGDPLPLVVMLHGCTQSPDDFAAGTGMNTVADQQNFLVAYPEQARSANIGKCWNWFNASNQRRDLGEPALIAGLTRQIIAEFAVQPGRIYVAGLSAGGAAAAIMGSTYPELYAAIGVHSGLACGAASNMTSALTAMTQGGILRNDGSKRAVPTIVFHGDRDTTVNVVNGYQVIAQSKGAAHLQASVTEGKSTGGIGYTRTVQSNDFGRPVLEEWILHGAGHAWSGGSTAGSFTDPRGPDASREMMRFFFQQSAPTVS